MMIFSNNKYYVCPRDIEIYLSAVLFYLAAALPYHIDLSLKTCRLMTRNKHQRKGGRTVIKISNYSPPPSPPPISIGLSD